MYFSQRILRNESHPDPPLAIRRHESPPLAEAMGWAGGNDMALKKARKDIQSQRDNRFPSSLPHFQRIRRTLPTNRGNNEHLDESKEGYHGPLVSSRVIMDYINPDLRDHIVSARFAPSIDQIPNEKYTSERPRIAASQFAIVLSSWTFSNLF
jgi:hypothetical protein